MAYSAAHSTALLPCAPAPWGHARPSRRYDADDCAQALCVPGCAAGPYASSGAQAARSGGGGGGGSSSGGLFFPPASAHSHLPGVPSPTWLAVGTKNGRVAVLDR
jgi:hypothetical protein